MNLKTALLILICVMGAAMASTAVGPESKTDRTLKLDAASLKTLEVDSGSGFLKIKGVKGLEQIEVQAVIITKNVDEDDMQGFVEKYADLSLEKSGSTATLISKIKKGLFSSIFRSRSARIDLTVRVPHRMALDIDDGSGFIRLSDIGGSVDLEDGSGSIDMRNINGDVRLDDGSGSIRMENIGGSADVEDGSGSITMKKVGGNVSVDDSSGSISIYDINGSVVVDDGSGGININGVERDVNIKRAGSGGVSISNVKGTVRR